VLVRGLDWHEPVSRAGTLLRPANEDLFQ
jgi:hypothetical protein